MVGRARSRQLAPREADQDAPEGVAVAGAAAVAGELPSSPAGAADAESGSLSFAAAMWQLPAAVPRPECPTCGASPPSSASELVAPPGPTGAAARSASPAVRAPAVPPPGKRVEAPRRAAAGGHRWLRATSAPNCARCSNLSRKRRVGRPGHTQVQRAAERCRHGHRYAQAPHAHAARLMAQMPIQGGRAVAAHCQWQVHCPSPPAG
mmetsp:Transcript_7029/g.23077  ORF Transcript_7029/g.23077 Transcript_7029/m.23077 type:complete len:207 (+) Transcript_7029:911-1531(+)